MQQCDFSKLASSASILAHDDSAWETLPEGKKLKATMPQSILDRDEAWRGGCPGSLAWRPPQPLRGDTWPWVPGVGRQPDSENNHRVLGSQSWKTA